MTRSFVRYAHAPAEAGIPPEIRREYTVDLNLFRPPKLYRYRGFSEGGGAACKFCPNLNLNLNLSPPFPFLYLCPEIKRVAFRLLKS